MDLDYLRERERIERTRASEATNEAARSAHRRMAELYRARIEAHRANENMPAARSVAGSPAAL